MVGMALTGTLFPTSQRLTAWLCSLFLLLFFLLILGKGVTGLWRGVLIDERDRISLSRTQNVAWTLLILSAFLTAALTNIAISGPLKALQIALPEQLWLLMGISVSSLLGSPLILMLKKPLTSPAPPVTTTNTMQETEAASSKKEQRTSLWSDLFKAEDVGHSSPLDLGKIQMFCFTLLLIVAYGYALGAMFHDSRGFIDSFPAVDNSIVALLGISHLGYLLNKVVPRP